MNIERFIHLNDFKVYQICTKTHCLLKIALDGVLWVIFL